MYSTTTSGRQDLRLTVLRLRRHLRTLSENPRARRDAGRAVAAHRAAVAAGRCEALVAGTVVRLCRGSALRLAA